MNPATITAEEMHAKIVSELHIEHLTTDEQNQIVEALGEVLLERATYEVMRNIPEAEYDTLDRLSESGKEEEMQAVIRKYVPNVEEVVARAVQEGIEEHKRLVAEEVESRMQMDAATAAPQVA